VRRFLPFALVAALVVVGSLAPFVSRPRPTMILPWDAPLTFGPNDIGGPHGRVSAAIWRPAGPPPYAVVMILSGCAGVTDNEHDWAIRLASWGYAAVVIDAFHPRGLKPLCERARVSTDLRVRDALNLADYLHTLPDFAGTRMALMGFSAGGDAALQAALAEGAPGNPRPSPFSAVVAYYPPCRLPAPGSRLAIDVQVLIGARDYPEFVRRCGEMATALAGTPHAPKVKFYANAQHIFDTPGGDAAAAADSFAVTKAFLADHLKAR
jgi:dienelactone hydrolase